MKKYALMPPYLYGILSFLTISAWAWQPFQTRDEQGYDFFKQGKFDAAAHLFKDKAWHATAAFRAGDYQTAARLFNTLGTDEGFYNAANALAKLQRFDEALAAYDKVLQHDPKHQDARYNRDKLRAWQKAQQQAHNNQEDKKNSTKHAQTMQQQGNQKSEKDKKRVQKKTKSASPTVADEKHMTHPPSISQKTNKAKEKALARETWLKLVPDDPGGLLREKFLRDYLNTLEKK